jgi:hypothetical protein
MAARTPEKIGRCAMCEREQRLTFHHLIPKTNRKNKWFKKNFEKSDFENGINICRMCHKFLHKQYSEKELGRVLNTLELIMEGEKVKKFIGWVVKQV